MSEGEMATLLERLDRLDARSDRMEGEISGMRTSFEIRFAKIEAKLDEKPSTDSVWRATATLLALPVAAIGGTLGVLKATGVI